MFSVSSIRNAASSPHAKCLQLVQVTRNDVNLGIDEPRKFITEIRILDDGKDTALEVAVLQADIGAQGAASV